MAKKNNLEVYLNAKDRTKAGLKSAESNFKQFGRVATAAVGAIGLAKLAHDFVDVNVEFQKLNASLITVTGSSEKADAAFSNLKKFAATTPYQLEEVVGAFIKMKALGLDPSNAALQSYGNTAAAMGKDLNQMIEAVADASTGEFERLKEFGVKSKSEGENVTFTFQGVATTVRKNAAEISGYLRRLGDEKFAGGMARQMDTLGGSLSNLKDAYANLLAEMGKGSAGDTMFQAVNKLAATLKDPQFVQAMANFATGAATLADVLLQTMGQTSGKAATMGEAAAAWWEGDISFGEAFFASFEEIRENIKAGEDRREGRVRGKIGPQTPGYSDYLKDQEKKAAAAASAPAAPASTPPVAPTSIWAAKGGKGGNASASDPFGLMPKGGLPSVGDLQKQFDSASSAAEAEETARAEAASRFRALEEGFLSEEELLRAQYDRKRAMAREYGEAAALDQQEIAALVQNINAEQAAREEELERTRWDQKVQVAALSFSTMTNLTDAFYTAGGKKSKKMFELNKAAAIGETMIQTYMSATKAFQSLSGIPVVGPALGAAAAAAAVAAGLANVAKIKSQKFGGGGGGGGAGVGGGGGTVSSNAGGFLSNNPVVTQPGVGGGQAGQALTIVVQGNVIGEDEWVEERLIPSINRATKRNVTLELT